MWKELFLLPNLLTLLRIVLSPCLIFIFDNKWLLFGFGFFASITDFLDGWIARQYNMRSRLGTLLDPIADKFLVLMFLMAAVHHGVMQPWMVFAMVFRDVYLLLAFPVFHFWVKNPEKTYIFSARLPGKIVTTVQFLCGALLILTPKGIWSSIEITRDWNAWPFLLLFPLSLWACIDYTLYLIRASQNISKPQKEELEVF